MLTIVSLLCSTSQYEIFAETPTPPVIEIQIDVSPARATPPPAPPGQATDVGVLLAAVSARLSSLLEQQVGGGTPSTLATSANVVGGKKLEAPKSAAASGI